MENNQKVQAAVSNRLQWELKKKGRQRGGHKAYIKTVLSAAAELLTAELDPKNTLRLRQQKITLEERFKTIRELDNQILDLLIEEQDIELEITDAGQFNDLIYETLLKIEDVLATSQKEKKKAESAAQNEHAIVSGGVAYGGAKAKLPKLIIRKFYGEAHKFQEFWDSFRSSVHDNPSLSPIDKFNYLITLTENPAYSTIAGLSLTEANYETALELLQKRYGQKQTIINSHIDTILKIQPLYNNADVTQLRKFYDIVEQYCRGLQALGIDSSSYGTILVNILLQRLPENIKLIISRKMGESSGDSEWKIEELLDILKTEVEAREKCSALNGKTQDSKRGNNYKSQPATAAALFTANRNRVPNCTFCKGVHASAECHVVTSIKERKNCLLKQGRCFLCMRKAGHLARDCDSSIKCFRCRGHHHVALCERSRNFYTDSKKQLQSSEPVKEAFENKNVQEKDGHSQTTFCGVNTWNEKQNTRVLLQTAYVKATNPEDASQNMKLRVILDSGSQRTYITKRARET